MSKESLRKSYLYKTPSKMTNDDIYAFIKEKISVMENALNKIQEDSHNLNYAVKIQEINDELEKVIAKKSDSKDKKAQQAITEKLIENARLLNAEKEWALTEIEENKQQIKEQIPDDIRKNALRQLQKKKSFALYERDNFITHLNDEKNKLTDHKCIKEIEQQIQKLKTQFEVILHDLEKDIVFMETEDDPAEIIKFSMMKLNNSIEAINKQHITAMNKLEKFSKKVSSDNMRAQFSEIYVQSIPHVRRLTRQITKVEENIAKIRQMKDEAIVNLEEKKKEIREEADPMYKTEEEVDEVVREIEEQTEQVLGELEGKHKVVREKKLAIEKLDEAITEMERDISRIQHEHDKAVVELEDKKAALKERLSSIEKLDLLINILSYKIYEAQHDYRKDMDELLRQREELLKRTDLTESQLALALAELDKKIADRKNMHEQAMLSLEGQRKELEKESLIKVRNLDVNVEAVRQCYEDLLADLEAQKLNATPSQLELINQKIAELQAQCDSEMGKMQRLQAQGWKDLNPEEQLVAMLEARGLRVTKSGRLLTGSGRLLTIEEAECLGLLEGIDKSWHERLKGLETKYESEPSASTLSSLKSSDVSSMFSRMTSEDVQYLKDTLGKPLSLGLAEVTAKQPRDPIHYLAHWLFKYRYNQELDEVTRQEQEALTAERERLARERWHQIITEEAKQVVLEMVIRAEEEAMRNEIEREMNRIAAESRYQEEENDDLESEARDILGTYNGPPIGQRLSKV